MALIWVGRRTAYLGRYREAIEIYTRGIEQHPDEPRLYRHRGHRYITVRELDRAVADLRRAAELLAGREPEVEPDGLPNARHQPTGTTHSSVWYHLGLALYLQGEFEAALEAYRECLEYSGNPDMLVATSYWLRHTLQRLGRTEEAAWVLEPISAEMDLIENHDYLDLLLLAKGERSPEDLLSDEGGVSDATVGYGVGRWYEGRGEMEKARQVYRQVLEGGSWAAFGYLAAEAELARAAQSPRNAANSRRNSDTSSSSFWTRSVRVGPPEVGAGAASAAAS
jgi:tetratricopeptide (TPR) repeat protein